MWYESTTKEKFEKQKENVTSCVCIEEPRLSRLNGEYPDKTIRNKLLGKYAILKVIIYKNEG